ncbi:Ni/Fe-hydrogenase, b-type cytochrome subunit [Rhodobacter capsulatus]|uniref:Probable Ni/Fe-hydrogenase B-type cytochrome subunit n=1 Tax=Rhodobacter capsulatus TaxID=1061 RepID=A0A0Q0QRE2_RHOCA|nr:Ni/Fe-hydrogenase, b-type cytochrome subunit [Rhodobacter capsulatus]KQB13969.1 Ni/Fe hydrogenase [Rhodobacter capsulatus]KQB14288.1 Ni/Fe hydrogenase [Rhodobacter capsulatus]PZX25716.1 Ni/Fe-hydrogenase 1 B-type cytochrome subunit [Rhodobacter capsulatus]QNR64020.1 Ni/Fe-hydrogenase, b-type cytochrome subunit [Rhodobacter capsulatus]WER10148.1 Ni/Fe-hydrogenase, b-type cytochrome subunit [Rhodobacter capsulatus]
MKGVSDERINAPVRGPDEIFEASRLTGDATREDLESIRRRTSVYVYEAPVRVWHWVNALAITILVVTGYLIASPLPSMQIGEATDQFVMGYIRFAHFAAGVVMSVGFFGRIYWAFVGNRHAWQMFYIPIFNKRYWKEFVFELRWYFFLEEEPKKYIGHNPLAHAAMFTFITLGITFMMITGWALYAEGAGQGGVTDSLFGWVLGYVQNSQRLHTLHHLGMWAIVIFAIIHIYAAVREDVMSRQSMVSTMISGHRTFKDDRIE